MIGFLGNDNGKPTRNTSGITDLAISEFIILDSFIIASVIDKMPPSSLFLLKSKHNRKQRKITKQHKSTKIQPK